jgi:hypothetical protein
MKARPVFISNLFRADFLRMTDDSASNPGLTQRVSRAFLRP